MNSLKRIVLVEDDPIIRKAFCELISAGSYFEIWSPALWSGQISQMQSGDSGALRFMGLNLSSGE